jgi:hypothetical protein
MSDQNSAIAGKKTMRFPVTNDGKPGKYERNKPTGASEGLNCAK